MFGVNKPVGGSTFGGQTQNQGSGLFGQSNTGGSSLFGSNQTGAAQANKPLFGQSTQQPQTGGLFGQNNQQQSGGLFGQNNQQQQSGGLFGQNNQQQSGGLFGQNNQQQSGGLFGQNNQQQSGGLFGKPAQPATGGLFGQNTQQQPQTGGLFGQNNQQKPQTGGLFGQNNQTQSGGLFGQNNQQPQTQTGGLFGQSQPNTGGGLFGQNNTQQQTGTSIFGNNNNNNNNNGATTGGLSGGLNQQQQGSSLFGSSTNTQPSSGGLFGNKPLFGASSQNTVNSNTNNSSTFSFGTANNQKPLASFGQQSQPQQQQSQLPTITPFTRPADMPEQFQKELEKMESYIRMQQQLSTDLSHASVDHRDLVESIPQDVQLLKFKLTSAKETLLFDDSQLAKLKWYVDQDYSDSELLAEVVNQPRKYDRLLPYFNRKTDCSSRLDELSLAMRDVHHVLTAEEFGKRITYGPKGVAALPGALKEEHLYFMSLSDRVAELDRVIKENKEHGALDEIR